MRIRRLNGILTEHQIVRNGMLNSVHRQSRSGKIAGLFTAHVSFAMRREGHDPARGTVERLMRDIGIEGVRRGKKVKTNCPLSWQIASRSPARQWTTPCPMDRVNRQFRATMPNPLWVSDFDYVSIWQGFVCVAFVIESFANNIVGWRASRSRQTQLVLDAIEQALYDRWPSGSLIHHSDRGRQYLSIKYTELSASAGLETSVGPVGESHDNALAETMIGLFEAEVIHRMAPSNGSTTDACSNTTDTSRQLMQRRRSMQT